MSFTKLGSVERFWSRSKLYNYNPVPKVMSLTRFKAILAFLQVTPPADINKGKVVEWTHIKKKYVFTI